MSFPLGFGMLSARLAECETKESILNTKCQTKFSLVCESQLLDTKPQFCGPQ